MIKEDMLLIYLLRFFLLFESYFTCVVLALDNDIYTFRSNYIPLYSIGRTNQTSCNNSRTHSPSNWTVNVADNPDGKLCEVQQSNNLTIEKTCNNTIYLIETNCFNTSEVDLTFTVHCIDDKQTELATVQIGIGDCNPYKLMTNCSISNSSIKNLQINTLEHNSVSERSGDFQDCRELISNFTDRCALTCDNGECSFNPKCLNGFDTRCFVKKYAVADVTCAPREDLCSLSAAVTTTPLSFVRDSTVFTEELLTATQTDDFNEHPSSSQSRSSTASIGTIVGGVSGSTIVVTMLILVLVFMYRRRLGLGDKRRYGSRKIPIRQHLQIDYTGVQNLAFPSDNGVELHTTGLQNDCYNVIPDDLMNQCDKQNHSSELFAETNGYCLAKPITGFGVDEQQTKPSAYEMAKPLPKDSNEDHNSKMGNYVDFTSGNYNQTNVTNGFHSDNINHYGNRGSDTYDTTNNQIRTRKSETDDVNPYDIRISGTYDIAKLHTISGGQEMSVDINPYDLRVSGIYDTTQQVAGGHKIHDEDDSVNDYDHFIGQKIDANYDRVLEK